MSKRIFYFFIFLIVFIGISIILYPSYFSEKEVVKEEYSSEMIYIPSSDFDFNNHILKAEDMNLEIPNDWIEVRDKDKISFYSSNIVETENFSKEFSEDVCKVNVQVGKVKEEAKDINIANYIEMMIDNAKYQGSIEEGEIIRHEVFFIKDKKGLKTTFDLKEAKYILLEIPILDKIYIIESDFIFSDYCKQQFEDILKTINFTI